jgi:hypothetical protein
MEFKSAPLSNRAPDRATPRFSGTRHCPQPDTSGFKRKSTLAPLSRISEFELKQRLQAIKDYLDDVLAAEDKAFYASTAYAYFDSNFSFLMGLAPGGDKLYLGLKSVIGVQ